MQLVGTPSCRVCGKVMEAVFAGVETRVVVRLPSGTELTVRPSATTCRPQIGATIEVGWNQQYSTLLPA